MIGITLVMFYTVPENSPLHYAVFAVYGAGIIWAIVAHKTITGETAFWPLFNQGFRCFMVSLLVTIAFIFIFNKMHPEFAEQASLSYGKELKLNEPDKTPDEINAAIDSYRKRYALALVYGSIFTYLLVGVAVSAVTSALTSRR